MKKNQKIPLIIFNIFAIILGVIIEEWITIIEDNIHFPINFLRLFFIEIFLLIITNALYFKHKKIGEILFKYRYLIGGIVIVICTFMQISGSSIGAWENVLTGNKQINQGVLLGTTREIRTDEWNVNTMMAFSKYYDDFSYFSNVFMGGGADNFIVYGQPVKDIGTIFRPFLIGYIFLTQGQGLAFFWTARLVVLFLVSFELMLLITKQKKLLSLVGAVMILFAPVVQWWFAINGLVEMLIFGSLAVVLLDKYMLQENRYKRLIYLILMAVCAGGYVLTFYPAWQVPLFYVFLGLAIWVIIKNKDKFTFNKIDVIQIISVLLGLGLIAIHVFIQSKDTIISVLNTVYPGKRTDTGGGNIYALFEYTTNLFFPMKENGVSINVCENARFFDLFPIGFIIATIVFVRQIKKKEKTDLLLKILIVISAILGYFCIFGFPNIISKISMLSFSTANRAYLAFGFVNVLILIRALSLFKQKLSIKNTVIITVVLTLITGMQVMTNFINYTGLLALFLICIIICVLCYLILRKQETLFSIAMIIVMIFAGGLVNPIRIGTGEIFKSDISNKIQEIVKQDKEAIWIYEGPGMPNILIANGAKTINSTNVYPQMDLWNKIDENKQYEDIYNRYAHIQINLQNTVDTEFKLLTPDSFLINLNDEDLEKLNVKYILTKNDLTSLNDDNMVYDKKYQNDYFNIYEVVKYN